MSMAARDGAGGGTGSARRWRERCLCSFLRHERMAVATALAESQHHGAQRQKTARAGREARDALHGEVPEAPLPQGGSRPPCLGEPWGPQVGMLRHTLEHMAEICPFVQILDAPVPQTGNQLLEVFRLLDTQTPVEQVIAVPKISLDCLPQRLVDRQVRVLLRLPRRTLTFQLRDVEGLAVKVLKVFTQDRIQQRLMANRLLTSQSPVAAFTILMLQLHPQYRVMSLGKGFFRTFHRLKKVRMSPGVRVQGCTRTRARGPPRSMRLTRWQGAKLDARRR